MLEQKLQELVIQKEAIATLDNHEEIEAKLAEYRKQLETEFESQKEKLFIAVEAKIELVNELIAESRKTVITSDGIDNSVYTVET